MKKMKSMILAMLMTLTLVTISFSHPGPHPHPHPLNMNTIDGQIYYLLTAHQKQLNQLFKRADKRFNSFDKNFFVDIRFMKDGMTQNFFKTIKANVEKGSVPRGLMNISYTSYTSINGKFKAVHYQYKSDGKNVSLIRATNNNGNVLKAIYRYNMKGKLLNVQEYKGDKLLNKKIHKIKV